jgi:hypothetical protein
VMSITLENRAQLMLFVACLGKDGIRLTVLLIEHAKQEAIRQAFNNPGEYSPG